MNLASMLPVRKPLFRGSTIIASTLLLAGAADVVGQTYCSVEIELVDAESGLRIAERLDWIKLRELGTEKDYSQSLKHGGGLLRGRLSPGTYKLEVSTADHSRESRALQVGSEGDARWIMGLSVKRLMPEPDHRIHVHISGARDPTRVWVRVQRVLGVETLLSTPTLRSYRLPESADFVVEGLGAGQFVLLVFKEIDRDVEELHRSHGHQRRINELVASKVILLPSLSSAQTLDFTIDISD